MMLEHQSFNKDCLPLLSPRPPKPKCIYCSGPQPLTTTPAKHKTEQKDPDGMAEKKPKICNSIWIA